MNEVLTNYTYFFKDQIHEMLSGYHRMLRAPIKQLIENGLVNYATVHGVSENRGHVIFKFIKKNAPRLKVQRSFVLIKRAALERWGADPTSWNCSFEEFLCKEEFHSSSSCALPLYHLDSNDAVCSIVGCGSIGSMMFRKIKGAISGGKKLHVLMFETEPPTRYLANLVDYIDKCPDDGILMCKPTISYEEWRPQLLSYEPNDKDRIPNALINALSQKNKVVLQGPPGTGKSFTAAQIIAKYLADAKSVCVTAMTNKALMELIQQPPLQSYLLAGKLSKTMLTSDEALSARGLKDADSDFFAPKGEAVFATYYKFSNQFRNLKERNGVPLYDLVVVEEASQAYLTTIAASIRAGKDCLIVGDPMQLAPIVEAENKTEYKRWDVVTQADGLSSFVLGTNVESFRITTTFRLTPASAELTGIFYGNTLKSVAPQTINWSKFDDRYFPAAGGVIHEVLSGGEDGVLSPAAVRVMELILEKLAANCPSATVAIITPFKDSAKAIQRRFIVAGRKPEVSVETIDRVQGVTVDYTILYCPLRNVTFSMDERRFNVATSRSRTTTLILSDFDLLSMRSVTGKVREFLMRVQGLSCNLPEPSLVENKNVMMHTTLNSRKESQKSEECDVDPLRINKILDGLQVYLVNWLQSILEKEYSSDLWNKAVLPMLNQMQTDEVLDSGAQTLADLDLAALISVLLGNFRVIRRVSHVRQDLPDLAKHIKKIRNMDCAHKTARKIVHPNKEEFKFSVLALHQFLTAIGTNEEEILSNMHLDSSDRSDKRTATVIKKNGITIAVK